MVHPFDLRVVTLACQLRSIEPGVKQSVAREARDKGLSPVFETNVLEYEKRHE